MIARAVVAALFLIVVSGVGILRYPMKGIGKEVSKLYRVLFASDYISVFDASYNPKMNSLIVEPNGIVIWHNAEEMQMLSLLFDVVRQWNACDTQRCAITENLKVLTVRLRQNNVDIIKIQIGCEGATAIRTSALVILSINARNTIAYCSVSSDFNDARRDLAEVCKSKRPFECIDTVSPITRVLRYGLKDEGWPFSTYFCASCNDCWRRNNDLVFRASQGVVYLDGNEKAESDYTKEEIPNRVYLPIGIQSRKSSSDKDAASDQRDPENSQVIQATPHLILAILIGVFGGGACVGATICIALSAFRPRRRD